MSHVPHDLREEFPDATDVIHALKLDSAHFRTLSDRYHDLNREIHRIESDVEPASDVRAEELKKQRLGLLDDLSAMISKRQAALA